MNKFWRAIIAGYGAKKLGGGCISTIIVFIIIYYLLGTCNSTPTQTKRAERLVPTHSVTHNYSTGKADPIARSVIYYTSIK